MELPLCGVKNPLVRRSELESSVDEMVRAPQNYADCSHTAYDYRMNRYFDGM
jgi:hypothetical protein